MNQLEVLQEFTKNNQVSPMAITIIKSHLKSPSPSWELSPLCHGLHEHTARVPTSDIDSPCFMGTQLCMAVLTTEHPTPGWRAARSNRGSQRPSKTAPSCLMGTYPCAFCSLTNCRFHLHLTSGAEKSSSQVVNVYLVLPKLSGRQKLPPNGTGWSIGRFSLPSRNWVLQAICFGVDTKVIMAIGLRQQRQWGKNEIEEYAFALWLQSPWWLSKETWVQRGESLPCLQPRKLFWWISQLHKPQ